MISRARIAAVAALALVAASFTAVPASADLAVNPSGAKVFHGTQSESVEYGGFVYFAADDGVHGNELWRTDGTPAGTTLVADLNPGGSTSHSNPSGLTVAGNRLFVRTQHASNLWVFDSPSAAPQRVTYAGTDDSAALGEMKAIGSTLIGIGYTHEVFKHTWFTVSPGSTSAVVVRSDVNTTAHPGATVVFQGYLYFTAAILGAGFEGYELWRTDGTAAGTRVVKDIDAGTAGAQASLLESSGSKVFYRRGYQQLWVSDGTSAGTKLVRDFKSPVSALRTLGGKVYLEANVPGWARAVWRSNGTPAGTFPIALGGFTADTKGTVGANLLGRSGSRVIYTAQFYRPAGSPHPGHARKVFYIDQGKADLAMKVVKAPRVKGTYAPGKRLEGAFGTWSPGAYAQSYQWLLDGKPVKGATSWYLWLTEDMVGKKVSLRVTANAVGAPEGKTTTKAKVVKGTLTQKRGVTVKGTARVGKTLKVVKPKFAQKGVKLSYQWYAGSKKIKKATTSKLKLSSKHRGKKISVRVTATKKHYAKLVLKSAKTAKVAKKKR